MYITNGITKVVQSRTASKFSLSFVVWSTLL